jgi:hypothetical protein
MGVGTLTRHAGSNRKAKKAQAKAPATAMADRAPTREVKHWIVKKNHPKPIRAPPTTSENQRWVEVIH